MLTDGRTDDGRRTDDGVTGILIAHLGAFGSGELKMLTLAPERYTAGFCMVPKVIIWCI